MCGIQVNLINEEDCKQKKNSCTAALFYSSSLARTKETVLTCQLSKRIDNQNSFMVKLIHVWQRNGCFLKGNSLFY